MLRVLAQYRDNNLGAESNFTKNNSFEVVNFPSVTVLHSTPTTN